MPRNTIPSLITKGATNVQAVIRARANDNNYVAMPRDQLELMIDLLAVHERKYRTDDEATNFDCENFAEATRVMAQMNWGFNGISVIYGKTHAWCGALTLDENNDPVWIQFEPQRGPYQNGWVVEENTGSYDLGNSPLIIS